ncbi:MAG: ribonuclease HII [Rhodospirillales bacterium]
MVLPPAKVRAGVFAGLADSKALSALARDGLHALLLREADVGLGWATEAEIDHLNILQASLLAMRRALAALATPAELALIDGDKIPPDLNLPARALVGGDARVLSIAAASVVAKVERDRLMERLDDRYPGYGWARNKGYPTREHRTALLSLGPTPHHRRSFAPVRAAMKDAGSA